MRPRRRSAQGQTGSDCCPPAGPQGCQCLLSGRGEGTAQHGEVCSTGRIAAVPLGSQAVRRLLPRTLSPLSARKSRHPRHIQGTNSLPSARRLATLDCHPLRHWQCWLSSEECSLQLHSSCACSRPEVRAGRPSHASGKKQYRHPRHLGQPGQTPRGLGRSSSPRCCYTLGHTPLPGGACPLLHPHLTAPPSRGTRAGSGLGRVPAE
mmetsp:Transcript_116899/g.203443  ORF Transcript_116899/g.203443 Transcript_116899/m.203443 type:complete len:207 (+) Transcript_116899:2030-2650(+)